MVDPITLGSSLALTGFGVYLLNRYRKQRQARLRALALLQKYSTSSRIALHEGRMRLLVSMPQVHQLPENEQAAWRERDERRDRNYLELDLIQPLAETEDDEAPDEEERQTELEARSRWMEANESPLQEHVTLVAEEHIGSGVVVATEADEEHEVNIDERLEREGGAEIVQTAPTVNYKVDLNDGTTVDVHNPADLPDPSQIRHIREPIVKVEVICPDDSIGDLMRLCETRRGIFKGQKFVSEGRQMLDYELPLAEIIYDFYDKLKSMTRGYGTMDYEIIEYRADKLVKVSILVNGAPVEALSLICHREKAETRTRSILLKLRKQIDRHQFEIALQAAIGGKIIARETVKSLRKNVTAKCYGGDVTRKRKLLEKQKKGKQRMKAIGNVHIPQSAFLTILEQGDN